MNTAVFDAGAFGVLLQRLSVMQAAPAAVLPASAAASLPMLLLPLQQVQCCSEFAAVDTLSC
jgi:hypothetical protein